LEYIGSLLAGTPRDGHRMSLASLALKQRKMYFQHTKDTASAQSLKETVQQRKKLGGTLRFGRYYLLPVTCISSNYIQAPAE
jgi:hypothetical protein